MRRRVSRSSPNAVFLNIPYDDRFRRLYLAYIVGLVHLGLEPRVPLGIPGGDRRLDRIMDLIQGCRYSIHEQSSKQIGIERFGAHDLRRTCAKLCRKNGGDLEQIKFLLGHSSIQTTERYLGSEQDIEIAVNDNLGL